MRQKNHDRRVERTRAALKHALAELIEEKGYDQVTVEEITERANLGRATFYLHYRDKEDLLLEDVINLVDQMVEETTGMPWLRWREAGGGDDITPRRPPPMELVFQHVAENANLYRIILHGQGMQTVGEKLRGIIIKAIKDVGQARSQDGSLGSDFEVQVPLDVIANYYAGSVMGLVTWWLENDTPYTPEQMAGYFQQLFFPGLMQVLSLPRS
jgi:AcrR family transcriptional regulator